MSDEATKPKSEEVAAPAKWWKHRHRRTGNWFCSQNRDEGADWERIGGPYDTRPLCEGRGLAGDESGAAAVEPTAQQAISSKGEEISALAGSGVSRIEYHTLEFSESQNPPNPNWVSRSKTITPPSGWREVSVSVAQWDFDLFPRERPITYLGVRAGVRLTGSTLEVTAYAICRDSNADDPWKARVTIQAIFLG